MRLMKVELEVIQMITNGHISKMTEEENNNMINDLDTINQVHRENVPELNLDLSFEEHFNQDAKFSGGGYSCSDSVFDSDSSAESERSVSLDVPQDVLQDVPQDLAQELPEELIDLVSIQASPEEVLDENIRNTVVNTEVLPPSLSTKIISLLDTVSVFTII